MINDLDTWKESLRNQSTRNCGTTPICSSLKDTISMSHKLRNPPKNTKFLPGTFQEHATAIIRVQLEGVASRLRPCNHLIFEIVQATQTSWCSSQGPQVGTILPKALYWLCWLQHGCCVQHYIAVPLSSKVVWKCEAGPGISGGLVQWVRQNSGESVG